MIGKRKHQLKADGNMMLTICKVSCDISAAEYHLCVIVIPIYSVVSTKFYFNGL